MMSTSFSASCLRIANISSCLRIVLAFSISCSSANARSSGGDLDFRSCSFISRMRVVLRGCPPAPKNKLGRAEKVRKEGRRSWVSAGILRGPNPDAPVVRYAGPGLDCIRLRSVGCRKHTEKQANLQGDGKKKLAGGRTFAGAG